MILLGGILSRCCCQPQALHDQEEMVPHIASPNIPPLHAVSCSPPPPFLRLSTQWRWRAGSWHGCSQLSVLSEPMPGETCASLSLFSLDILFFLLEISHGRRGPNKEQGWGNRPLSADMRCSLPLHRGRGLTGANFKGVNCSLLVSRGARALK